jgi:hypothetical protein
VTASITLVRNRKNSASLQALAATQFQASCIDSPGCSVRAPDLNFNVEQTDMFRFNLLVSLVVCVIPIAYDAYNYMPSRIFEEEAATSFT